MRLLQVVVLVGLALCVRAEDVLPPAGEQDIKPSQPSLADLVDAATQGVPVEPGTLAALENAMASVEAGVVSAQQKFRTGFVPDDESAGGWRVADWQALKGTEGIWLFWAHDAPRLPEVVANLKHLQQQNTGVVVRDVYVQTPRRWLALMSWSADQAEQIAKLCQAGRVQDARTIYEHMHNELQSGDLIMDWLRPNGIPFIERLDIAVDLGITQLPTWVYTSKNGLAHKLEGAGRHSRIANWLQHCRAWEDEHVSVDEDGRVIISTQQKRQKNK